MTADLLAENLLHLSLCPWKSPALLQHISVTSSLPCLHSSSYRLNHQPNLFSALTVSASQIITCQVLCLRLLKALELIRGLCLPSEEAAMSEASPSTSQG